MKTPTAKLMLAAVATAICLGANAEITNTVKVTKFHQSQPYSGKATVEYTVGGKLPAYAGAEFILTTDDTRATFSQSNIVVGANSHEIDFASSFGGAQLLTNASFVVSAEVFNCVQLWENGPYWGECNVGASKPEEDGYYFWWGDTVGYTNSPSGWISVKDGTSISFDDSDPAYSTMRKSNSVLLSEGYIDSTGILSAAHDAATVHLGAPWRMPTEGEFADLIDKCTFTWTSLNGVNGIRVTGKGDYSDRSIFIPSAGESYWSSTPNPDSPWDYAWRFCFYLSYSYGVHLEFSRYYTRRYWGYPVRPVRD
ncbi:MAG: hypothetical protein II863_19215 [Kiritimatiellae bacterium]|nr:hypothetical protein [Kiritimatiellia bacterium]